MKKVIFTISLALAYLASVGQEAYENEQIRSVFSQKKPNGGYGAITMSYSNIGGYDALVTGGRGAIIFDHVFAVGLAGYGFINNMNDAYINHSGTTNMSLVGGYGGLLLEPIIAGKSPVHVSIPILVGAGGVSLEDLYNYDSWEYQHSRHQYDYDAFFVVEPGVELELNLTHFLRLAAVVSYRHTSKIKLPNIGNDALKGFNYGLTFKFGRF